jgi:hypothetical protein
MKQIIFAIHFLVFAMYSATAQDSLQQKMNNPGIQQPVPTHPLKYSKEYFVQKSARCKKAAWVMLGVGTAMAVGGCIAFDNAITSTGTLDESAASVVNAGAAEVVAVIGAGMVVSSIPLFIASHHYKKKAMNMTLSFKMQPYRELQQTSMTTKFTPGLSFKINF